MSGTSIGNPQERSVTGPATSFVKRHRVVAAVAVGLAVLLLGCIAFRIVTEHGDRNSYALVAQSFLTAVPWADRCFDFDCVVRDGRYFVIFPPLPGAVAIPLVWLFGIHTIGFIAIGLLATAMSALLWWRILHRLGLSNDEKLWMLAAVAFASPLFFVTLRADGVWFFAQVIAFPLVTLAIHEAQARRLVTAGLALGCAFLCRQMSIFYAPILLLMVFAENDPLLKLDRTRVLSAVKLGLPIAAALLTYFAYNHWRFGNIFDTGYAGISFQTAMLKERADEFGIWNKAYVVFNFFYLFIQGFHATFADPQQVTLSGLDSSGTGILTASPWLLFAFFVRMNRVLAICCLLIAGMVIVTLFYHSNGFTQFNTQRYVLDWLPAALLVVASGIHRHQLSVFKLLVLWGMILNIATMGVIFVTRAA